jgi:Schlafen, AlbA_2
MQRTLKRERWMEAEVLALPAGEHDYFERKGAGLLQGSDYREKLAKAICAFANSGGGSLLIGVSNNGGLEGIEPRRGKTSTRDWFEQIVPSLVAPPLADFRVHEVEPAADSEIPSGRVVLVIDVGDSILAPHQAEPQKGYFYRAGGRSEPAPHFYLEALRNRLVGPVLVGELTRIDVRRADSDQGGMFVEARLVFRVRNDGNVAAYQWAIVNHGLAGNGADVSQLKFDAKDFPKPLTGAGEASLPKTILPGMIRDHDEHSIGFRIQKHTSVESMSEALSVIFLEGLGLVYRVVSEVSRGEERETKFRDVINLKNLAEIMLRHV